MAIRCYRLEVKALEKCVILFYFNLSHDVYRVYDIVISMFIIVIVMFEKMTFSRCKGIRIVQSVKCACNESYHYPLT